MHKPVFENGDYGIDAPPLIRTLFIAGIACMLAGADRCGLVVWWSLGTSADPGRFHAPISETEWGVSFITGIGSILWEVEFRGHMLSLPQTCVRSNCARSICWGSKSGKLAPL